MWRWVVLAAISVSYLVVFTQRTGPGVIGDQLQAEFHVSAGVLGTITSIQYLLYMLLQIPIGVYGDKSGPERMLVIGVLLDGVGTLVFTSADTFLWLLVGRAIVGIGDSLIWVNIVLILAKWFAKGRFAAVLAVANTAGSLGSLVTSVPLAAWIAVAGWHMPFRIIGLLLVALAIVDFFVLIVAKRGRGNAQEDLAQITIQRLPIRAMLAKVVRDRLSWSTFCCHFGAMGTYLAMVSLWVVPYFMSVYGVARSEAAWFSLVAFMGALVAGPIIGWVSDRLGDRRRPYFVTQSLGTLAWLTVVVFAGKPPIGLAGVVMFVVGFGCGSSLLTFACIRDHVKPELAGVTSGFANSGGFLSAVLLPVLFGAMIDANGAQGLTVTRQVVQHAYSLAFLLPTIFSVVGVIGSLTLPKGNGAVIADDVTA